MFVEKDENKDKEAGNCHLKTCFYEISSVDPKVMCSNQVVANVLDIFTVALLCLNKALWLVKNCSCDLGTAHQSVLFQHSVACYASPKFVYDIDSDWLKIIMWLGTAKRSALFQRSNLKNFMISGPGQSASTYLAAGIT